MPGGQVKVNFARHLASGRAQAAVTAGGQDLLEFNTAVKVSARDVHAVVGQNVVFALHLFPPLGSDAHQREVGGAATNVSDQHQLLVVNAAFKIQRGCNRLKLKADFPEANVFRRFGQRRLRAGIAFWVVIDKKDRSAQHHARQCLTCIVLRQLLQVP